MCVFVGLHTRCVITAPATSLGANRTLGELDLTGTISPAIGSMEGLQVLELGFNRLTGTIPESLRNLTDLRMLSVYPPP